MLGDPIDLICCATVGLAVDGSYQVEIIGLYELVDQRDSMNAAVYEPERGLLHFAMGQVPATSGPWVTVDVGAMFDGSGE